MELTTDGTFSSHYDYNITRYLQTSIGINMFTPIILNTNVKSSCYIHSWIGWKHSQKVLFHAIFEVCIVSLASSLWWVQRKKLCMLLVPKKSTVYSEAKLYNVAATSHM